MAEQLPLLNEARRRCSGQVRGQTPQASHELHEIGTAGFAVGKKNRPVFKAETSLIGQLHNLEFTTRHISSSCERSTPQLRHKKLETSGG